MHTSGTAHSLTIAKRAARDALLFAAAYGIANYVRFTELWRIDSFAPPIVIGALVLVCTTYILGLYSVESQRRSGFRIHLVLLTFGFLMALIAVTLCGYISFDQRVGRGFMALGCLFSYPLLLVNHWFIFHKHRIAPRRIAFLVESESEMIEYQRIRKTPLSGVHPVGRISISPDSIQEADYLGSLDDAPRIMKTYNLDCLVFSEAHIENGSIRTRLRQLRYLGITCTPLIDVCEKHLHYVPLHLVSLNWLLYSEKGSRNLYFSKMKRLFDIISSLVLMVVLAPFLLVGMAIVRIFSPEGPMFFTQERVGRFGKPFTIWKLRSMRLDAESAGPVWSAAFKDPRVFPGGALLRKYRIDEIPQLINVLRGDMSFVGPRPERPGFVKQLSETLPFYEERHMIHPGLTGWAQVCYPYGASIEDSKCKLEYDLYYLKHAGVVFDLLILLDTVRVVLGGGLKPSARQRYSGGEASEKYSQLEAVMSAKIATEQGHLQPASRIA
ncbi:sugar transferase [Prosthecobacter sp.]|uniref:sugar transferase n=1 Tax=Prosthecobacter sp. TaxID=1965333 RepID=UPI002488221F|nr:sugar transferase [Prosthecobacter sp.]MDI1310833.1 sugar transferase [Prosthecobacter sp.]